MKQTIFYAVALTVMMAVGTNSHAKSWRVNNDTTRGAQFADINAAMSSADVQDGDTLYLDPGSNLSSNQNVTKCVTIIGNGFFHDLQQPYGYASISGRIYLKAAGCKIEGVVMSNEWCCFVAADNVTIERCKLTGALQSSGNNCKNAIIRNCYFSASRGISGQGTSSLYTAYWTIENNIIFTDYYNDYGSIYPSSIASLYSPMIRNNYIYCGSSSGGVVNITNGTILNNIIVKYKYINQMFNNLTDCIVNKNVLSGAEDTTYPSNKFLNSNDQAAIFTMTGANDLQYQLCENSPAKGYAIDGGDCGPYGSGYTYVPGGLPLGMPYYTEATIGSMAHDGKVNVTLKISVQDE